MKSFKDFLLEYSTIKKIFIEDFYEIIREDYFDVSDKFLINSNTLQEWLHITSRQDFHDTIKRSYIKDKDYIITKSNKKGIGKNNEKNYMLTPDCAKMILQSTKSKKGIEVRKYFIEIEKMLYKYKDIIIKNLNDEIDKLRENQKPKKEVKKSVLYIFQALNTELTLYKIGKTKNIKNRLKSYNSNLANDLKIVREFETDNIDLVETCIKTLMKHAQYRKYKEIYEVNLEIIEKLMKQCDSNINLIKSITNKKLLNDKLYMYIPNNNE